MLIGHNPEIGHLAVSLCGSGPTKALERMRGKFPTAALAVIQFDIDRWDQLAPVPADCARSSGPRIWHESVRARYPGDRTASAMMNLLAILGLGYAGVVVLLYLLQTSLDLSRHPPAEPAPGQPARAGAPRAARRRWRHFARHVVHRRARGC